MSRRSRHARSVEVGSLPKTPLQPQLERSLAAHSNITTVFKNRPHLYNAMSTKDSTVTEIEAFIHRKWCPLRFRVSNPYSWNLGTQGSDSMSCQSSLPTGNGSYPHTLPNQKRCPLCLERSETSWVARGGMCSQCNTPADVVFDQQRSWTVLRDPKT
jgi:hypothetical protein